MTADAKRAHLERGLALRQKLEELETELASWYGEQTALIEEWAEREKTTGTLTLRGYELERARPPTGSLKRLKRELEKRMTELDRAFRFTTKEPAT